MALQCHRNTSVCVQEGTGADVLKHVILQQTPQVPRKRAYVHREIPTFPVTPTPASDTPPPNFENLEPLDTTKSNHYLTQVRKAAPSPETREGCSSRKEVAKLRL